MKALYCLRCATIASPPLTGAWRFCDCKFSAIRWSDPTGGFAEVWCADPFTVRVIGLNNLVLSLGFDVLGKLEQDRDEDGWRTIHQTSTELVGDDYLFHKDHRACWAVLFRPGDTSDVKIVFEQPEAPDA